MRVTPSALATVFVAASALAASCSSNSTFTDLAEKLPDDISAEGSTVVVNAIVHTVDGDCQV